MTPLTDKELADTREVIRELRRAQAVFQLRAIAAHMGLPHPSSTTTVTYEAGSDHVAVSIAVGEGA